MPKRLPPGEKFLKTFGQWIHAPRVNVHSEIRCWIESVMTDAYEAGRKAGMAQTRRGKKLVCAKCGSEAWEQVRTRRDLSGPEPEPGRARERLKAFLAQLDAENQEACRPLREGVD